MGQEKRLYKFCDRCKKETDFFMGDIRIRSGSPSDMKAFYETIELCINCNSDFWAWFNDPRLKK